MEHIFTEAEKADGIHMLEVEEVVFTGEKLVGGGTSYRIYGAAVVDGENYPHFAIEFDLETEPAEVTAEAVMAAEWDSYDFLFDLND